MESEDKKSKHFLQIVGIIIITVDEKMFVSAQCLIKWLHIYCVN